MQEEYLTFITDFNVQGRFAYLSHQETLTFWQRVLVRARLPLVYSRGFNPRPRISLPLPRSVGVQSDCERLCVLTEAEGFCPQAAAEAIKPLLPEGCTLISAATEPGKAICYPVSATYQFSLAEVPDANRLDHFRICLTQLEGSEPVLQIRRMDKGRQRPVNIRPFLDRLSVEGQTVRTVCAVRPDGTVRIDELMRWLGLEPCDLAESVRRIAVCWAGHTQYFQGENETQ